MGVLVELIFGVVCSGRFFKVRIRVGRIDMNARKIAIFISLCILLFVTVKLFEKKNEMRVVFFSDAHAVVDDKDRNVQWNINTLSRIKSALTEQALMPSIVVWLGDMIDFLPAEWEIVQTWIDFVGGHRRISQYGVMGNHDYLYYNYPEILGKFNRSLKNNNYIDHEIESTLSFEASVGDVSIRVVDASAFLAGHEIILIETPDHDHNNKFWSGVVRKVNVQEGQIVFESPLTKAFSVKSTAVRQGFSENRGVSSFLKAFKNTKSQDTKGVFFVGNTCFILLSMDRYFKRDFSARGPLITEQDMLFLEQNLLAYKNTHNIIVVMHELPDSGSNLGGLFDPSDSTEFDDPTRLWLRKIIKDNSATAWVAGHTHPNARTDSVHYSDGVTNFFLSPSIGTSEEGQLLYMDLQSGSEFYSFKYWSLDGKELIKEVLVPAKNRIDF